MMVDNDRVIRRRVDDLVIAAVFFVFCFAYLRWMVEPGVIYYAFGDSISMPGFRCGWEFFRSSFGSPGGPVQYAAGFLSHCFYYPPAAVLIITAVAFGYWVGTELLLESVSAKRAGLFAFVPALGVMLIYSRYRHELEGLLALLVSLALAVLYVRSRLKSAAGRAMVYAATCAAVYYVAAGATAMFVVFVLIYELKQRRWLPGIMYAVVYAAGAYLASTFVFGGSIRQTYLQLLDISGPRDNWSMPDIRHIYIYLPVAMILFSLPALKLRRRERSSKRRHSHRLKTPRAFPAGHAIRFAAKAVVLAAVCYAGVRYTFDGTQRDMLVMNSLYRQGRWRQFLTVAGEFEKHGIYDVRVNHDVNSALCHLGRLGDEMFSHMQTSGGLVFLAEDNVPLERKLLRAADVFYWMGNVNSARHWACEHLEVQGPTPHILKRLAEINMVRRDYETAKVFLNYLSKDIIYGAYARETVGLLGRNPSAALTEEMRRIRSFCPGTDRAYEHERAAEWLADLLEANPKNRMAFEYLMALHLLAYEQKELVENLPRLKELGYDRIPVHWQEAILIYSNRQNKPVDLCGYRISSEMENRFMKYLSIIKSYGGNKQAALPRLASEFGNSYFFYSTFGVSGAGR